MAKVKYYAKEKTMVSTNRPKVGTHSFYAVPVLALQAAFADYRMVH